MTGFDDDQKKPRNDRPSGGKDSKPSSAAPLRKDVDTGRGRDKVNYPDPAAAPLGTDDEAAGTPISEEQLKMARAQEDRRKAVPETDHARTSGATGAISVKGANRTTPPSDDKGYECAGRYGSFGSIMTAIVLIVAVVVIMFAFSPV